MGNEIVCVKSIFALNAGCAHQQQQQQQQQGMGPSTVQQTSGNTVQQGSIAALKNMHTVTTL